MAEFSKLVITRKGQALIAKVLAGTAADVEFLKVAASSAAYAVDELEGLENLSEIMQEAAISAKARTNEVAVKVETAFSNTDLTAGYYMRTLGLYAIDPDDGEILYAVTVEMSGNCYMPPYNGVTVSGAYIQLITTVGNADNVNLEVNPGAIATIGDIKTLWAEIEKIREKTNIHSEGTFFGKEGVHGFRYYDGRLQIQNPEGEWDKVKTDNIDSGASSVTVFNDDGSITTTYADGESETTEFGDGTVTRTCYADGQAVQVETTTFNADGSIKKEVQDYELGGSNQNQQ